MGETDTRQPELSQEQQDQREYRNLWIAIAVSVGVVVVGVLAVVGAAWLIMQAMT